MLGEGLTKNGISNFIFSPSPHFLFRSAAAGLVVGVIMTKAPSCFSEDSKSYFNSRWVPKSVSSPAPTNKQTSKIITNNIN